MQAEHLKHSKYTNLESKYDFVPMAVEISREYSPEAHLFCKDLGHWLHQATLDSNSLQNLIQQILVVVQRGNAAAVLGYMGTDVEDLRNYFSQYSLFIRNTGSSFVVIVFLLLLWLFSLLLYFCHFVFLQFCHCVYIVSKVTFAFVVYNNTFLLIFSFCPFFVCSFVPYLSITCGFVYSLFLLFIVCSCCSLFVPVVQCLFLFVYCLFSLFIACC